MPIDWLNTMKRRNYLKAVSAATGVASAPTVVTAKKSFDEIYKKALEIREQTGKREPYLNYLRNRVDMVKANTRKFQVPVGTPSEGPGTQELDKVDITTSMTLSYYIECPDDYGYVDYEFSIDSTNGNINSGGKGGPDHISLGWNGDHYRIVDYTWYTSDNSPNLEYNSSKLNGIDFIYRDGDACGLQCDINGKYVGTKVDLLETDQERAIRGEWRHTWDGVNFSGFGVSSGGTVFFSTTPVENFWEGKYETREDSDASVKLC